jgi:ABC-type dipeptide/oligopeptide/nickel transport system ATPase component
MRSTISLTTTGLNFSPGSPPDLIDPPPACRFHPRCPDAMQVCVEQDPVPLRVAHGTEVECWLHGPQSQIPAGGTVKLERREIGVADEA